VRGEFAHVSRLC